MEKFKLGDLAYLRSNIDTPMTVIKISDQYGINLAWMDKDNRLQEIPCVEPGALLTSKEVHESEIKVGYTDQDLNEFKNY
ncbi:hypothetical protein ACX0G7_09735 [Flavitalea antarctica]